jgi:hypothetical protein
LLLKPSIGRAGLPVLCVLPGGAIASRKIAVRWDNQLKDAISVDEQQLVVIAPESPYNVVDVYICNKNGSQISDGAQFTYERTGKMLNY